MFINENFFDDIDNDVMVSSSEESSGSQHHIAIVCNVFFLTEFSSNAKALFRNMFSLMDNILDDYQFSISKTSDEVGDIISAKTFNDYYDDVLSGKNYIKDFAKSKTFVMNIYFNGDLSFIDHVYLMNTLGLIAKKIFTENDINCIKCDSAFYVNLYSPDPEHPTYLYQFVELMIEQYKKVYDVDVVSEQQIKRVLARYGARKNDIRFLTRCLYSIPVNTSGLDFGIIEAILKNNQTTSSATLLICNVNEDRIKNGYGNVVRLSEIMGFFGDTINTAEYNNITISFNCSSSKSYKLIIDCVVPDEIIKKLTFRYIDTLAIVNGCTKEFMLRILDDSDRDIILFNNENKRFVHLYDLSDCKKEGDMVFLPKWIHKQNIIVYNITHKSDTPDSLGYIECLDKDYSYPSENVAYRKFQVQ